MTLTAGVDDAGRGPVIGPLILAGVLLESADLPRLQALGVRDSKLLTPTKRAGLKPKILDLALRHQILEFCPAEVDRYVLEGGRLRRLNWLEAKAMAQIIRELHPEVAYVDASDVDASRFGSQIQEMVPFQLRIISEHHADRNHPIVAAASIVAKVYRDQVVEELRNRFGDFGSGYPSDPRTLYFLEEWQKRYGGLPDFVRKSWKTAKRLQGTAQTHL